jgi:hypothetical protein
MFVKSAENLFFREKTNVVETSSGNKRILMVREVPRIAKGLDAES